MVADAAIAARGDGGKPRPQSLSMLLSRYMPALRTHLVLGRRMRPDEADDLLQSFVTSKVLEQDLLGRADRSRGKFRSYLLTALDRYQIDWQRAQVVRRRHVAPGPSAADSDVVADPSADSVDAFSVDWARALLNHATQRTRDHFRAHGRDDLWEVFRLRVLDPILLDAPPPPYDVLSSRLGYATATQACSAVQTAKRTFARVLREIISEYAERPEQVDEEIADLHRILSGGRA
jgi:RNA polymerase sigma-70 factor (ECF subfamily)